MESKISELTKALGDWTRENQALLNEYGEAFAEGNQEKFNKVWTKILKSQAEFKKKRNLTESL